nr:hypothetical protein B0A51_09406 [Rachicladosporium sp. CCFEE 5018]
MPLLGRLSLRSALHRRTLAIPGIGMQKWKLDGESVPDAREEPVLPIVEEAEQKAEIKKEEREGEDEEKHNGETSDYQTDAGQEQTEGEETETAIEEDE